MDREKERGREREEEREGERERERERESEGQREKQRTVVERRTGASQGSSPGLVLAQSGPGVVGGGASFLTVTC